MVVATNLDDTERHDLKTLPGAYVVIKRMSWGDKLTRQAMVSKMTVQAGKGRSATAEIDMMTRQTALFDFAHCVVDHNLTDATERPLDMKSAADVDSLRGQVGEEINTYIDKMNNFELDDEENPEGNS